jgi:hypothetical protein
MCYAGKPVTVGHEGRPTDASKRIPKAEVVDLVLQNHPDVGYNDIGGLLGPKVPMGRELDAVGAVADGTD